MGRAPLDEQVAAVAALEHPLSRRAYELVVDHGWVSRDEAAAELEVARSVAAFHLDKLTDAGLLQVRYERTSGRTGPGAGRTAKLYACSTREVDLSLPPRRYDLAGSLLADALVRAQTDEQTNAEALRATAREEGLRIGQAAARERGRTSPRTALLRCLTDTGYRPRRVGRDIVLANCPFHSLVERHPDLVCQMNLDLLTGVVEGLECADTVRARLEPVPSQCCVRLGA